MYTGIETLLSFVIHTLLDMYFGEYDKWVCKWFVSRSKIMKICILEVNLNEAEKSKALLFKNAIFIYKISNDKWQFYNLVVYI